MKENNFNKAKRGTISYIVNNLKELNLELLTKEEEYDLLRKAQEDGDTEARDLLILYNCRLVIKIANHYKDKNVDFEDLIQEGIFGIDKAINKFNLESDNKFSTYATWWIRHSVTRYLTNNSRTIRYPIAVVEIINKIKKLEREIYSKYNRKPTKKEYEQRLELPYSKIQKIIQDLPTATVFEQKLNLHSEDKQIDLISNVPDKINIEASYLKQEKNNFIYEKIKELSDEEQYIVLHTFGINTDKKTKTEIKEDLKLASISVLNQILEQAMRKLKLELKVLL